VTRPARVAVVYYSATGNVHRLAHARAEGAGGEGAEVRVCHVEELASELIISQSQYWLELNQWALSGEWTIEPGASVLNAADGRIRLRFRARDVHLVLRARETAVAFRVLVDGVPPGDAHGLDVDEQGRGTLVEPGLYQLIRQRGSTDDRTFEIAFDASGVEASASTFG